MMRRVDSKARRVDSKANVGFAFCPGTTLKLNLVSPKHQFPVSGYSGMRVITTGLFSARDVSSVSRAPYPPRGNSTTKKVHLTARRVDSKVRRVDCERERGESAYGGSGGGDGLRFSGVWQERVHGAAHRIPVGMPGESLRSHLRVAGARRSTSLRPAIGMTQSAWGVECILAVIGTGGP
eukprot:4321632-Pyramimonas_sp.AAC.1